MTLSQEYEVAPPAVPAEDLSGDVGLRLLRLLSIQGERGLRWVEDAHGQTGVDFAVPSGQELEWPLHALYQAASNATVFAALARFGEPGGTMGGVTRERMEEMAVTMIRAVIETHPVSDGPKTRVKSWHKFNTLRMDYIFGMGAWLLWEKLPREIQLLVARILEHDADLFNGDQAPALLYDDTQGESNAWTASGLALAYCMLRRHPRRTIWGEKAKEFMISAYATERDVASERLVDGIPLKDRLHAPNAFPDYTVENHGFIHPIYMAAVSEMVRTAICYRLALEPIPEATTFNADHVFDSLMRLNLPDGNHLYVQGTDYDPRRMDSFFQACNVIPLKPDPLREACFLRVLGNMEYMARERPGAHISGNILFAFDFGVSWGLTENYMMRRLFGSPATALPEDRIEAELIGVRVNEPGKFAVHRTARAISSFSWHTTENASQVMGITMPLDKDVLCCAHDADGYIGEIEEASDARIAPPKVVFHSAQAREDGISVTVELERCGGGISQRCAFISLPDGLSVYFEQRVAKRTVTIASAESGNARIYDDLRWPFQKQPRSFHSAAGILRPELGQIHSGNWINIDNRMGYVALGADKFTVTKSTEFYHAWRLAFLHFASPALPRRFEADQRISSFALVSCPNQNAQETADMARIISERGWQINDGETLAFMLGSRSVSANFSRKAERSGA